MSARGACRSAAFYTRLSVDSSSDRRRRRRSTAASAATAAAARLNLLPYLTHLSPADNQTNWFLAEIRPSGSAVTAFRPFPADTLHFVRLYSTNSTAAAAATAEMHQVSISVLHPTSSLSPSSSSSSAPRLMNVAAAMIN